MKKKESINVFGNKLHLCCNNPKTGFFRNGLCDTCEEDVGVHTVCVLATEEFLIYSKSVGNDLSTPNPEFGFTGVKVGDKWCLCALRWKQAYDRGVAPPVFLESTHIDTLKFIDLETLKRYALN